MNKKWIIVVAALALAGCRVPEQVSAQPKPASTCDATTPGTPQQGGLAYTIVGSPDFREQVLCILNDSRSWAGVRYASGEAHIDFTIEQISGDEAAVVCGKPYPTEQENRLVSCSPPNIVAINMNRWDLGVDWRIIIVNHEVGHQLGHDHNYGAPCSVMHDAGCPSHPYALWPPKEDNKEPR